MLEVLEEEETLKTLRDQIPVVEEEEVIPVVEEEEAMAQVEVVVHTPYQL